MYCKKEIGILLNVFNLRNLHVFALQSKIIFSCKHSRTYYYFGMRHVAAVSVEQMSHVAAVFAEQMAPCSSCFSGTDSTEMPRFYVPPHTFLCRITGTATAHVFLVIW